jgi:hypothetical protein
MTSIRQEKPSIETLLTESGTVVDQLRKLRYVRQLKALESVRYRRKLFNILNEVESLMLDTHIYNPTKRQLVEDFDLTKGHIAMALRVSIVHLHKICEFDVNHKRNKALKDQMEIRNQKDPKLNETTNEEDIFSENFSPADLFNNQSDESNNKEVDLFDLLTQYGLNFPI